MDENLSGTPRGAPEAVVTRDAPTRRRSGDDDQTALGASLAHSAMIDFVLTGGGVDGVATIAAQKLGGTVAIVLPEVEVAVVRPGRDEGRLAELKRYVSAALGQQQAPAPARLAGELPVDVMGERLGLVMAFDVADARHLAETLALAAVAARIAITLADDTALAHGTALTQRRARADLLEDVRRTPGPPVAEVLARARKLGCDLALGASALCARVRPSEAGRVLATIEDECPGALAAVRDDRVEALLPATATEPATPDDAARRLARRLRERVPVALAPFERGPAKLGVALLVADIGLLLTERVGVELEELLSGSWRLLAHVAATEPHQLDALIDTTVGPALLPGRPASAGPVETLSVYLDNGGSMTASAEALYLHRHTVAAHLSRIGETTGHDPLLPRGQEQLALGLKALAIRRVLAGLPIR